MLFPGTGTEASRVNADLGGDIGLLPARLTGRKVLSDENAATLNPASVAHPALSMFKDTSSLNVASARFTQYFGLEPTPDANDPNAVQVMMKFNNGDPAFVERHVQLGKVILAASSAGSSWNQLPLKPSYVPLVYQLLFYLGQGAASHRNVAQEEPLFLALPLADANKPVRVTTPDGRVEHAEQRPRCARRYVQLWRDAAGGRVQSGCAGQQHAGRVCREPAHQASPT